MIYMLAVLEYASNFTQSNTLLKTGILEGKTANQSNTFLPQQCKQ